MALGKDTSTLNINQFVEHVKRMHVKRDKGFEEEFKVHTSFSIIIIIESYIKRLMYIDDIFI